MDFKLSDRSNRTCALANLPERVCRQFPQKGEKMALSQALRSGCLNTTLVTETNTEERFFIVAEIALRVQNRSAMHQTTAGPSLSLSLCKGESNSRPDRRSPLLLLLL